MSALLLLVILLDDAPTQPPGTMLPNKVELVRKFRTELARWREPLDNFYRRQTFPGRKEGVLETWVQMNGDYCKSYSKDHLNVERLEILTPTEHLGVVRLPYGPEWKVHFQKDINPEAAQKLKKEWPAHARMIEFGTQDWGLGDFLADPPKVEVTKVTAERVNDKPVYRYHFTRSQRGRQEVTVDVDPTRSWAIVHITVHNERMAANLHHDMEFAYEGTVHGRPALKRYQYFVVEKTDDGKVWGSNGVSAENPEYVERTKYDPAEYTLDFYKVSEEEKKTPWLAYYALALTAATVIGYMYLFVAWRKGWRYRAPATVGRAEADSPQSW